MGGLFYPVPYPQYVPPSTWAAKPAANAVPAGTRITISDVGPALTGSDFYSDGVAYWKPVNGVVLLAQSAVPVSLVECNTAITWTLAADPGNGKTRITSSGAHGLTAASNGYRLSTTAWSGTGVAGFYVMTYVDATNVDLTLTYAAGLGNPTVVGANIEVTLLTVTVPALTMGINGKLSASILTEYTNSVNNKVCRLKFGGALWTTQTQTSTGANEWLARVRNRGATNSQIGFASGSSGTGLGTASAATPGSVQTSSDVAVIITAQPAVANEFIQVGGYQFTVESI